MQTQIFIFYQNLAKPEKIRVHSGIGNESSYIGKSEPGSTFYDMTIRIGFDIISVDTTHRGGHYTEIEVTDASMTSLPIQLRSRRGRFGRNAHRKAPPCPYVDERQGIRADAGTIPNLEPAILGASIVLLPENAREVPQQVWRHLVRVPMN